jgi:hypothetical protein
MPKRRRVTPPDPTRPIELCPLCFQCRRRMGALCAVLESRLVAGFCLECQPNDQTVEQFFGAR